VPGTLAARHHHSPERLRAGRTVCLNYQRLKPIVRGLREPLVGRQFTGVRVGWDNLVARPTVEEFKRRIVGQKVLDVKRRGKYLVFSLSGGEA